MKILQFGRFWGDVHGGIERHVASLIKGLSLNGHQVVNLVASQDGKYKEKKYFDADVIEMPSLGKLMSVAICPDLIRKAVELDRKIKFDVFHFHYPDPLSTLISRFLNKDTPRLITWHSDIIRQKKSLTLYQPFLNYELERSRYIIAATKSHFSSSVQIPNNILNVEGKCQVIPFAFDFDSNSSIDMNLFEEITGKSNGGLKIFALGRLVYYKGFEFLIEAAKNSDCLVYIGGAGPLHDDLKNKVDRLGLSERVFLVGALTDTEVRTYMKATDVFCLPSCEKSEAFGIVQLEAMSLGKPLLTSYLGNGVNEVGIDGVTGFFFENKNSDDLARKINILNLDRNKLKIFSENSFERAKFFNYDLMIEKHEKLYDKSMK